MAARTDTPNIPTRSASKLDLSPAALWKTFSKVPGGRSVFTRAIRLKAPYFGSIAPHIHDLRAQRCEVRIKDRRRVRNHLGTVHAIAMCNMAELAAGMATEVTAPTTMRWIPVGMTVQYQRRARGDLRAIATLSPIEPSTDAVDVPVDVQILDPDDQQVMHAEITMRISPKATR